MRTDWGSRDLPGFLHRITGNQQCQRLSSQNLTIITCCSPPPWRGSHVPIDGDFRVRPLRSWRSERDHGFDRAGGVLGVSGRRPISQTSVSATLQRVSVVACTEIPEAREEGGDERPTAIWLLAPSPVLAPAPPGVILAHGDQCHDSWPGKALLRPWCRRRLCLSCRCATAGCGANSCRCHHP